VGIEGIDFFGEAVGDRFQKGFNRINDLFPGRGGFGVQRGSSWGSGHFRISR